MECGVALMCHTNNFHFYSKDWYGGPEMPTSGDLKSGDSLFCITAPPPHQMSTAPTSPTPPAKKMTQPLWLRTLLWSLTWSTWRNNLCQRLNVGKNVLETVQWIKKSLNCEKKNELNFKPKHRKAQKSILCGRFGDPNGTAGDLCPVW